MPPGDSRNVELSRMKNKLIELEGALKEEKKVVARLRDQGEKKLQQIMDVDTDIAAEQERFRWAKEDWLFQVRSAENDASIKVASMKEEQKNLLEEISEFAVLQYENEQLHIKLKNLSIEHKKVTLNQFEEREKKKQRDFDLRMQMDEIFRKTLKNVDENYEQQAIEKMKYEASQATVENEEIYKEFDLREKKTEDLIRQQQHSYDQLMKLRIEKDVLGMSIKIQEKNIRKFRNQNIGLENEVKDLLKKVERLRDQVQALSLISTKKADLYTECASVRNETLGVKQQIQKYKRNTMKLSKTLLLKGIRITERATMNQNNQLSEEFYNIGVENNQKPPVAQDDVGNYNLLADPSVNHTSLDIEAVWRSKNETHSKIRRAQKDDTYFSQQSFSMSAL